MSLFHCLCRTKVSDHVNTSSNPQAGGPPLVGLPLMLIQYFRIFPRYWWPFLLPQTEDAPCCGDRDPLITVVHCLSCYFVSCTVCSKGHLIEIMTSTVIIFAYFCFVNCRSWQYCSKNSWGFYRLLHH